MLKDLFETSLFFLNLSLQFNLHLQFTPKPFIL